MNTCVFITTFLIYNTREPLASDTMTTTHAIGLSTLGVVDALVAPERILAFSLDLWDDAVTLRPLELNELGKKLKCVNHFFRNEVHERVLTTTPEHHLDCMYDRVFKKIDQWLRQHLRTNMGENLTRNLSFFFDASTHVSLSARDVDVTTTGAEPQFALSLCWKHHLRGKMPDESSVITVPYIYDAGIITLPGSTIHAIVASHANALFCPLLNEHLVRAVLARLRDARTHESKVFDDAKVCAMRAAIARMARQGPPNDERERAAKRAKQ